MALDDGTAVRVAYTPDPVAVVEPPRAPVRVEVLDEWMFGTTLMITGKRLGVTLDGAVRSAGDGAYNVIINGKVTMIEAESPSAAFVAVAGRNE